MKNPVTEEKENFSNEIKGQIGIMAFPKIESTFVFLKENLLTQFKKHSDKIIPIAQMQAVEALAKFDSESEDQQWEVLEALFNKEKDFEHLRSSFEEYISTYALYVHELSPHQKTILIKHLVTLYPEVDKIDFNL